VTTKTQEIFRKIGKYTKENRKVLAVSSIVLAFFGFAIILYTTFPIFTFRFYNNPIPYQTEILLKKPDRYQDVDVVLDEIPEVNTLVIPKINVNIGIVEGETLLALKDGAWRHPTSGKPGEGGNTVISGHRFRFLPPNNRTFYFLDKLEKGDDIIVYWEGVERLYQVEDIYEVLPNHTSILYKGDEEKLTIYTCTPLFTQSRRLIVEALPL
jgi:LPXTG-site transpeptidase (sortase) family protein